MLATPKNLSMSVDTTPNIKKHKKLYTISKQEIEGGRGRHTEKEVE